MNIQHNFWTKLFKKHIIITTVPKKILRLDLTYLCTQSLRLRTKIDKLFKNQLPFGKLETIFRATPITPSCFRSKDTILRFLSSVLYMNISYLYIILGTLAPFTDIGKKRMSALTTKFKGLHSIAAH